MFHAPPEDPSAPDTPPPADPRHSFLLALARALHAAGEPTPRNESRLSEVARVLGIEGQFIVSPTFILMAFGPEERQHVHLLRTVPGGTNLGNLARVDEVARLVLRGRLSAEEGSGRLEAIRDAKARPPEGVRVLAFALASGAAGRFVGGGLREMGVAALAGLALGLFAWYAGRHVRLRRLLEPMSGLLAGVLVTLGAFALDGISFSRTVVASLIVLFPGMVLTTAMQELTVGHLMAGTTRLMSAVTTFLGIGFGFALAVQVTSHLLGAPPQAAVDPLPGWTVWVALLIASASFGILLRAEWRSIGWIVAASVLGYATSRLGGRWLGPELGAFAGALAVGLGSNLREWFLDEPAAITEVPGILVLVPGSIGFQGITAMLEHEVMSGVETGFQMLLIASSLVAGLLIANLLSPQSARGAGRGGGATGLPRQPLRGPTTRSP